MLLQMNKFMHLMVTLQQEGYEFSVFVRKGDRFAKDRNNKLSDVYLDPITESLVSPDIWDSIGNDSVADHSQIPSQETHDYKTFKLAVDRPSQVEKYVESALKLLRQVPCKVIAKVWIKIIEPKKKTKYPYIKGDSTKPSWWPNDVEHKEPDHLRKPDRLRLLCAIIIKILPQTGDLKILQDLKDSTFALSILKNEPEKRAILCNLFDICKNLLINYSGELKTMDVINLGALKSSQRVINIMHNKKYEIPDHGPIFLPEVSDEENSSCASQECKLDAYDIKNMSESMLLDVLVENDPDLHEYLNHFDAEDNA
ncbi:hypothetical protein HG535_0G04240 [Zygotorulaspora mrakii]|uniref:Subtelomeric hrmA-associated cluster protein AFUB-079030/YDR124W-like helical bundle domain-containing protein n=1 Tax=Zygotorulaspora mrakii TaxID=42260 RepID=A0A7H9B761_ZYGMR|nr:uncharacterized protein HG535_0G04240 [Zygotorulaspora mrakii]QLG74541.1 hypothetical protein HG535_0G04240 [Zygotorulaspora mrakii]